MKKIALAFYGLLRNIDLAYPFWKENVIDPLNIKDIYVHTYKDDVDITKFSNTKQFSYKLGPSVTKQLIELYKPIVFLQSEYDDVKKTTYWFNPTERIRFCVPSHAIYTIQSIFYSMYNVINFIPENTYDYVILSKIDQIFTRPLKYEEINTRDDELLTSNFMCFKDFDGIFWSNTDFFVIGNFKTIKKYANIGIKYKELYESGVTFHVEIMLGENLRKQNVKTDPYFIYPMDHHYIRDHEQIINIIKSGNLDTWSPMTLCYKK